MAKTELVKPRINKEFAALLPPLSTDEFTALKADIKANGVRVPIVVDENGYILDGMHRFKIDKNAPYHVIGGLTEPEKLAFTIRASFVTRNMSPAQKKEVTKNAKRVAKQLRELDKTWTQKRIAETLGVARETVRDWFMPNGGSAKTHNTTDSRTKVNPKAKPVIADRVACGASQSQVASDYGITQSQVSRIVTAEAKQTEKKQQREAAAKKITTNCGVIEGDFRIGGLGLEDDSVDLIFTDPPYDEGSADLYKDLAEFAARVLTKGGWLLAYSGHVHLPRVYKAFSETPGIEYAWTFCCLHSGGDSRFRKYKLQVGWKPIVAAFKPKLCLDWDWFKDVVTGGKEKDDHEWQQAESEASYFVERLAPKHGLVCDPFCGSGTTLVAAKAIDRKWIGYEIETEHVTTARIRLDDQEV